MLILYGQNTCKNIKKLIHAVVNHSTARKSIRVESGRGGVVDGLSFLRNFHSRQNRRAKPVEGKESITYKHWVLY